jgi:hypothetical protein
MFTGSTVTSPDAARWYDLTDQYAAAVLALQRGDFAARAQLYAVYAELKYLAQLQGRTFPSAMQV